MALLTLQQILGSSATQDATTITFLKSELLGLTPQNINTPDSILAAIINNVHQSFQGQVTDQKGANVTDQNGIAVNYDNHLYYSLTWLMFWGILQPGDRINTIFLFSTIEAYED